MTTLYTTQMTFGLSGISTSGRIAIDESKAQISLLDTEKIPYDESIKNLDRNLYNQIVETNNTLYEVRNQYQLRIDDQECRSDLFWRVIGIHTVTNGAGTDEVVTLRCTKLEATYDKVSNVGAGSSTVGFTTASLQLYTGSGGLGLPGITTVYMGDGEKLVSAGSDFDVYYQPDNLHGLKLHIEPYSRDIFDTFVATGIGSIGIASTELLLITPNLDMGIETGQLVTSPPGVFATTRNVVVGISSTTMDLRPYSDILGIGTESSLPIPKIILQDATIGFSSAPNVNGEYTSFTFSKDPNTLDDSYAVNIEASPYVDQDISMMGGDDYGKGVEIEYDNSGISSAPQQWNRFLEGFPDPDQLPDLVEVEKPKVGADKIYYRVGFDKKPIIPLGGLDAEEGDTVTVTGNTGFIMPAYETLSACDDTALDNAITNRNTAEAALSADSTFGEKLSLSNSVRLKRNDINLAIWAYRAQIGSGQSTIGSNDGFMNLIETSPYKDIMNQN